MKTVYVVLGVSRSGTSMITRSLASLGVYLGVNLLQANTRNPKGFFEDVDVRRKINRGVFYAYGQEWMPLTMSEDEIDQHPALLNHKHQAVNLIQEQLKQHQQWGFKDPRTIEILPFWKSVFKTAEVNPAYILIVRHPLAVAKSIHKNTHIDLEMSLALWAKTFFMMLEGTQGKKRVLVNYELILEQPRHEVERIHRALSMEQPINQNEINHYANEFIDHNLRHFEFTESDLTTHHAALVVPVCAKLFSFARQLAREEISLDSATFHEEWRVLKNEYLTWEPTLNYLLALQKHHVELTRKMRDLKKSIPWKLVYPLHIVDDFLRKRRHAKRYRG